MASDYAALIETARTNLICGNPSDIRVWIIYIIWAKPYPHLNLKTLSPAMSNLINDKGLTAWVKAAFAQHEELFRRSLLFASLFAIPLSLATRGMAILDPDIWWHLSSAKWMVEHQSVPNSELFSDYGQSKPWIAASWLYECLVYATYTKFGLAGLPIFTFSMTVTITLILFSALRSIRLSPTEAIGLTASALFAMAPNVQTPRPWLFSILLFTVLLWILVHATRFKTDKPLYALPPMFALWANVHVQFLYGLFFLAIFIAGPALSDRTPNKPLLSGIAKSMNFKHLAILALCVVATILTPYHIHLHSMIFDLIAKSGSFSSISEMQAMNFRTLDNWAVLGLTIGAFSLVTGMKRHKATMLIMLISGTLLSFKSLRDIWLITLLSTFTIAINIKKDNHPRPFTIPKSQMLGTAFIVGLFIITLLANQKLNNTYLKELLGNTLPLQATEAIKKRNYPGPLYNQFAWGGFLTWYLPEYKVNIYGGANILGNNRFEESSKTWEGMRQWADNPEFQKSRLIIGKQDIALTSLLKLDPKYVLVYQDKVSAVFIRKQ